MVQKLTKASRWPFTLTLIGWCCFIAGIVVHSSLTAKLCLLGIARVLP